jgi:hypothetical protein
MNTGEVVGLEVLWKGKGVVKCKLVVCRLEEADNI